MSFFSLDGHGFSEISWTVDVETFFHGYVIGQKLKWDNVVDSLKTVDQSRHLVNEKY